MNSNRSQSSSKSDVTECHNHECQALIENEKCGEVKSLEILKEFQQLYENKINQIRDDGCQCSSTQLKIQMLNDWVKDLTEQNTLLVQVVEELEHEASERVALLEERLRNSSKTSFEIMQTLQDFDAQSVSNQNDILKRMMHYQSDINNLTEFVRRIRDDGNWDIEGLHFYSVAAEDLCGSGESEYISRYRTTPKQKELEETIKDLKLELSHSKLRQEDYEKERKMREKLIQDQSEQIEKLSNVVERCASNMPDRQKLLEELHELRAQLKIRNDDFNRLELSVKDMREALTAEVADKHDNLVALRRECQLLEERCRQADKQTHFKDDIIKEMRKELKQYRSKYGDMDCTKQHNDIKNQISYLEEENKLLRDTISNAQIELSNLRTVIETIVTDKIEIKEDFLSDLRRHQSSETIFMIKNPRISNDSDYSIDSQCSADFNRIIHLLKVDIDKMVYLANNSSSHKLNEYSDMTTLQELSSKDQLIKDKDEMIRIQSDSLKIAQNEMKELRNRINEIEKDKDIKMKEIRILQSSIQASEDTITDLKKALNNYEEKSNNLRQTADLYMETIQLLENSKHKAELEVEQQRITIGNLQDALVSVKQQLEGVQGRNGAELKEKSDIINSLYLNLSEMQTQYIDCYGEIVTLTQTIDCLRNSNLDLKVLNTDLEKDIVELDDKLIKSKEKVKTLEETIKKVISANEILEEDINYMKKEMSEVSHELKVLQGLLKISSNDNTDGEKNVTLKKSLHILREHSGNLVEQLKLTQSQISHEMEMNQASSVKILELEKQLDIKNFELQRSELELADAKSKLNISLRRIEDYECKIVTMEKQIADYQKMQNFNEQKNEEIVISCNMDLNCLKQKIDVLNKILTEKSNEILKLHAELSVKSDTITNVIMENKELKEINGKQSYNMKNLEQQLKTYKMRCDELFDKYKICKLDLETVQKLTLSEEDLRQDRNILVGKLESSRREEVKLNKMINDLKAEMEQSKTNLKQKDENLAKTQQELNGLREEVNRLIKIRSKLTSENQKLQDQISKLCLNNTQFENRNRIISEQLEKCVSELNALQNAKTKLEERNMQIESEMEHLQKSFSELNQEFRYKHESVVSLEHELSETKCSRDEICAESRIVVNNVRSWLEEQKRINVSLSNTVKEKNTVIEELTLERNLLLKNIKEICERYETLTEELHVLRQYLSELNTDDRKLVKSIPLKRSVHTWGSQGSISCGSPSPVFMEAEIEYCYGDESGQEEWMQKVNTLSADLDKSKNYWKKKLGSKQGDKKIIPLKESATPKTN